MTEYWLQKKTIGGWSHVTYYVTEAEARINFDKVSGDLNGYCWRLVKAEVIEEKLLNDVVEIETPVTFADAMLIEGDDTRPWGKLSPVAPKSTGWGADAFSSSKSISINPKPAVLNSWGDLPADSDRPSHKGVGKVCMINHVAKVRTKVDPSQVEEYIKAGYEKGGPRTQFREG